MCQLLGSESRVFGYVRGYMLWGGVYRYYTDVYVYMYI